MGTGTAPHCSGHTTSLTRSRSVWAMLSGTWCDSCEWPGAGLDDSCGSLPAQDVPWFYEGLVCCPFPKPLLRLLIMSQRINHERQTVTNQRGFGSGLIPYLPSEAADGLDF